MPLAGRLKRKRHTDILTQNCNTRETVRGQPSSLKLFCYATEQNYDALF